MNRPSADIRFQLPILVKSTRRTTSQGQPSIYARCWPQRRYGVKQEGLNPQLARVACRIPWTLSVRWKLDVFSTSGARERENPSLFLSLEEHVSARCRPPGRSPRHRTFGGIG